MSIVYKITYPNGKVYIGRDRTNSINYFGGASSALIAEDFPPDARRTFTITREILWESATATPTEVISKELEFIRLHRSNDPSIGYKGGRPISPRSVGRPSKSTARVPPEQTQRALCGSPALDRRFETDPSLRRAWASVSSTNTASSRRTTWTIDGT